MQNTWLIAADRTETEEGGYSCRRGDDGNWTLGRVGAGRLVGSMKGVSAPTMVRWLGDETLVTAQVMQAIDQTTYRAIANAYYWRAMNGDALVAGVDNMLFDFGYNSGVSRAARQLQHVVGLTGRDLDGDIGRQTLQALAALPQAAIVSAISKPYAICLQKDCGVANRDGVLGPLSRAAITGGGKWSAALIYALASQQDAAYRSFRTFSVDGAGWLARLERRLTLSLQLNAGAAA